MQLNMVFRAKVMKFLINIKSEEITVIGKNSLLNLQETKMNSDGSIKVNNLLGAFELKGANSNLKTDGLDIIWRVH